MKKTREEIGLDCKVSSKVLEESSPTVSVLRMRAV